jgi:hypothetical protein
MEGFTRLISKRLVGDGSEQQESSRLLFSLFRCMGKGCVGWDGDRYAGMVERRRRRILPLWVSGKCAERSSPTTSIYHHQYSVLHTMYC